MRVPTKRVNMKNFRYYIYYKPFAINFSLYDKYELVMLAEALLDEFQKVLILKDI